MQRKPMSVSEHISALVRAGHPVGKAVAMAQKYADGGPVDDVPDADPKKAKEFVQGATASGWNPQQWLKNIKEGLGISDDTQEPKKYAVGGSVTPDMSPQDLATLQDMFGSSSPALGQQLDAARAQALQDTLGKSAVQDAVSQATTPASSLADYENLFGAEKGLVPSGAKQLPLPTGADAGFSLNGPSYGAPGAGAAAESGAAAAAEGALPAIQGGLPAAAEGALPAIQGGLPAVAGGAVPEAAAMSAGGAGPGFINTTGRVLGEEAAPFMGSAVGAGLQAALVGDLAGRGAKYVGTGEAEQDLKDLLRGPPKKYDGHIPLPAEGGPPGPPRTLPGDAAGPSLFDMVSGAYQKHAPEMMGPPAPAGLASRSPAASAPQSSVPATAAPTPSASPAVNPLLQKYLQDRQDMKDAQEKANTNRLIAGIAGASGQLAASTYGATKPFDEAAFKTLDESAGAPVTALQNVQAAGMKGIETQQALMKAQAEQEGQDVNSPMAQRLRAIYKPIFAKAGLPTDALDTMGAADIKAYAQNPLEFAAKMKEQEIQKAMQLEMMRTRVATEQGNKDFMHLQAQQNAMNHEAQKPQEAVAAADNALKTIDLARTNPIAWSATPMMMARQLAGGSRINKQEIEGMQGSKAIADRLMQIGEQAASGTITPENQKFFAEVTQSMKDAAQDDVNNITMRHVKQYAVNARKPLSDAYESVVGMPMPAAKPAGGTVNVVDPQGNIRSIPQDKVQAAIAAGGKLAQ